MTPDQRFNPPSPELIRQDVQRAFAEDIGDGDATANTDTSGGGTLLDDLVLQVAGRKGSEVFTFQQGASVNQIVSALRLVSDATGVTASQSAGTLTLESTEYGSTAFVNVDIISEGNAGGFRDNLSAYRATGADISATVNGIQAGGNGNTFSINTSTLDLKLKHAGKQLVGDAARDARAWLDRAYTQMLSRPPTDQERNGALEFLGDEPTPDRVTDLLWSLAMLPEFQLIN